MQSPKPPSCTTSMGCPETLTVPTRAAPLKFSLNSRSTLPLPLPPSPETMLIQPSPVLADQLHALAELTATLATPPLTPTNSSVFDSVTEQSETRQAPR